MPTNRMTAEEYRAYIRSETSAKPSLSTPSIPSIPRPHKYGARRVTINGITYDSQLEADRHQVLLLEEAARNIVGLRYHQRLVLQEAFKTVDGEKIRKIEYEADFTYWVRPKSPPAPDATLTTEMARYQFIIEDTKGYDTPVSKLKRKLLLAKYPHAIIRVVANANDLIG